MIFGGGEYDSDGSFRASVADTDAAAKLNSVELKPSERDADDELSISMIQYLLIGLNGFTVFANLVCNAHYVSWLPDFFESNGLDSTWNG
jgi:hypothetical protein